MLTAKDMKTQIVNELHDGINVVETTSGSETSEIRMRRKEVGTDIVHEALLVVTVKNGRMRIELFGGGWEMNEDRRLADLKFEYSDGAAQAAASLSAAETVSCMA